MAAGCGMSKLTPDEKMLQDYIQNKLSAEQTEAVDFWLADHPQALQDMQLDLMFAQGLEEIQADKSGEHSQFLHLPGSDILQRVGLAVAMAVVFVLGGLTVHFLDKDTGQSMSQPDIVMLSTNRGIESDTVINGSQNTVIQIPAGYLSDDPYAVELTDNSKTIYRLDHVTSKDDLLTVFVPKNLLVAGDYQLKVTNLNTQDSETFGLLVR